MKRNFVNSVNSVNIMGWVLGTAIMLAVLNPAAAADAQEAKLIAVLKSSAPQKEKADACRELGRIATKESVPTLAALLGDEQMAHMARHAMETIPDPAVDVALREALGKVKGRLLTGVIGSLGMRKDAQAVEPLGKLLNDADPLVAQAAARALGSIGVLQSARLLTLATIKAKGDTLLAVAEGLLRCAEAMSARGQREEALAVYDRLRLGPFPPHVRAGGLRGTVLTKQNEGLPVLVQAVRGDDFAMVAAAARAAMELPGTEVAKVLATELPGLSADKQVLILQTLGKRGDAAALPAVLTASKTGPKAVRVAAIRAVPEIGGASAVPVLVGLLGDPEKEVAQAAQESLAGLSGPDVDGTVMELLNQGDSSRKLIAIDLIAQRRMLAALPALLKLANDPDTKMRLAALKRVGELGGMNSVPVLLGLLTSAKASQDIDAAEQAVSAICGKTADASEAVGQVAGLLAKADPAQKGALLRILGGIGGPAALKAVSAAAKDPNNEVRAAAIRALGDWKNADAAPELLALAQTSSNAADKMRCLRGYLRLAGLPDVPADQQLAMCQKAAGLIQRDEEKKQLLSTLGGMKSPEALTVIVPYLNDPAVKEEAGTAILAIAERILKDRKAAAHLPRLEAPVQKVVQTTTSPAIKARAEAVLKEVGAKKGK